MLVHKLNFIKCKTAWAPTCAGAMLRHKLS